MNPQEKDDLASAYERFVRRGVDVLSDTGFPVTTGLRTAILATGWAESRFSVRRQSHGGDPGQGFWAINIGALRRVKTLSGVGLARVKSVLVIDVAVSLDLRTACRWNDELAAAVAGLAIYPALPRTHPTTAWNDLNIARRVVWDRVVDPVTEDEWDECARIAAA